MESRLPAIVNHSPRPAGNQLVRDNDRAQHLEVRVKQHGGHLSITSAPGVGTSVHVVLQRIPQPTVEAEAPLTVEPKHERPYLLWVGSGSYRKGLHHLCLAWEQTGLASEAELIVVARVVDPGMAPLLARPGIRWIRGLPRAELNWHFRHARAFVLPSMSEGFGQVYLEALAKGCPVIGTRHSILPDVAAAQPWIRYVEPGVVPELAAALAAALRGPSRDAAAMAVVAESVQGFTWENFRSGIEAVLSRFD